MYFVGGVGDFSVQLDRGLTRSLFLLLAVHPDRTACRASASRGWRGPIATTPSGKAMVFGQRLVVSGAGVDVPERRRCAGSIRRRVPIFPAVEPWHDDDTEVDAFWGPSVHWNMYLGQYVMLLNHAKDANWSQEGIYVSFAPSPRRLRAVVARRSRS